MKWISVKERLPEENITVLVKCGGYILTAEYNPKEPYKGSMRYSAGPWTFPICDCCDQAYCIPSYWCAIPEVPEDTE